MKLRVDDELLTNIKTNLPELTKLLEDVNNEWAGEDGIYRFYHQSFKVCYLQGYTLKILGTFERIRPEGTELNPWFKSIVNKGTGKNFDHSWNSAWVDSTIDITTAFFHAKYFLEMAIKYGKELDEAPSLLPTGWAALLYLYNSR